MDEKHGFKPRRQYLRRLVLLVSLLTVPVAYFLLRAPAKRYSDFLFFGLSWRNLFLSMALLPEALEPDLVRLGVLPTGLLEGSIEEGGTMLLDPADLVDRLILASGSWERTEWRWIRKALNKGDVFVDIGAHHGSYTLRAARAVGDEGLVVAVEPNPISVKRLEANIARNGYRNVKVFNLACGDRESTLKLFLGDRANTGMSSLSPQLTWGSGATGGLNAVEVPVRPLDMILEGFRDRRIAAIKIDTEGAETMILRGSTATIRRHAPVIVLEVLPQALAAMGSSVRELEDLLNSFGYSRAASTTTNALWIRKSS